MPQSIEERVANIEATISRVKITIGVAAAALIALTGYTIVQVPRLAQKALEDKSYQLAVEEATQAAVRAKGAANQAEAQLAKMPNVVKYGDVVVMTSAEEKVRKLYAAKADNSVGVHPNLPAGKGVNEWTIGARIKEHHE